MTSDTSSLSTRPTGGLAFARDVRDGLAYPLTSNRRLLLAAIGALLTYVLLVLSTFPQFTLQVLSREPSDVFYAVTTLTREVYLSTGAIGLGLVAAYAVLTGIAVTNTVALLGRARRTGVSTVLGIVPGVLAAGCASCGAGILGALGFIGAMAALPFDGNLFRLAGTVLLVFFLGRAGDPRTCSIDGGNA